jgi:hypothetical protein
MASSRRTSLRIQFSMEEAEALYKAGEYAKAVERYDPGVTDLDDEGRQALILAVDKLDRRLVDG